MFVVRYLLILFGCGCFWCLVLGGRCVVFVGCCVLVVRGLLVVVWCLLIVDC